MIVPALGQVANIGTLYDSRAGTFLPESLMRDELLHRCIEPTDIPTRSISVSFAENYEEKLQSLGLNVELGATILAGLFKPGGPGFYLNEKRDSNDVLEAAIHHKISTSRQNLLFTSPELRKHVDSITIESNKATHVVIGIEWGSQDIITISHRMTEGAEKSEIEKRFYCAVEAFKSALEDTSTQKNRTKWSEMKLDLMTFGDTVASGGIALHDIEHAYDFLTIIPDNIKTENGGKGKPIAYELLPVEILSVVLRIDIPDSLTAASPSSECLRKYLQLSEKIHVAHRNLNDCRSYALKNRLFLGDICLQNISQQIVELQNKAHHLKTNYARILGHVREGAADPDILWKVLRDQELESLSLESIALERASMQDKVEFLKRMIVHGATYIGYNNVNVHAELARTMDRDSYVFSFNEQSRYDEESWSGNTADRKSVV